ncbi:putative N-succinyldiaminopimelate aminotransferase DapC [compost metagenome]
MVADGAPLGFDDGVELCRRLPGLSGVVGVPVSAFCRAPGAPVDESHGPTTARSLASRVRFTFVKREDVLRDAIGRLGALREGR